jgi:hypothetical protein
MFTEHPHIPLAAELAKQGLLHYAADKMESNVAKTLVRLVNSGTSIEDALGEFCAIPQII